MFHWPTRVMFLRVWLSLFRDDFSTALSIFVNITFKYTHISYPYVEYFSMYHIAGGMILDYLKVLFLNIVTDCFELSSRLINDMGASRHIRGTKERIMVSYFLPSLICGKQLRRRVLKMKNAYIESETLWITGTC